jgi:hypothetical protein
MGYVAWAEENIIKINMKPFEKQSLHRYDMQNYHISIARISAHKEVKNGDIKITTILFN